MKKTSLLAALLLAGCGGGEPPPTAASVAEAPPAAQEPPTAEAPTPARVFFVEPADGAVVSSPFVVRFGLEGKRVAPAGVDEPNSGHHHLLIDMETLPDLTQPLPATEQLLHFGGGQTETTLELPPGEHTLQLLLGNYLHVPHDPPLISETITITVE